MPFRVRSCRWRLPLYPRNQPLERLLSGYYAVLLMTQSRRSLSLVIMAKLICYMIMLGILSGCTSLWGKESYYGIPYLSDEEMQQAQATNLCWAYALGSSSRSKIRAELLRRNIFSEKEWQAIDANKIFVGMSELAFRCNWYFNSPLEFSHNLYAREGPWGERKVFAYSSSPRKEGADPIPGRWPKVVYVENGVIVAYQESRASKYRDCISWFRKDSCFDFESVVTTEDSDALLQ